MLVSLLLLLVPVANATVAFAVVGAVVADIAVIVVVVVSDVIVEIVMVFAAGVDTTSSSS